MFKNKENSLIMSRVVNILSAKLSQKKHLERKVLRTQEHQHSEDTRAPRAECKARLQERISKIWPKPIDNNEG